MTFDEIKKRALQKKQAQKVLLKNIPPSKIENTDSWLEIIEKGDALYRDLTSPTIDNDSFVFTVNNKLEEDVIKSYFPHFKKLYYEISGKTAHWKTMINANIVKEMDKDKKALFDEFASSSDIVNKINDLFNLDLT